MSMNLELFESYLLAEKKSVIESDMRNLCIDAVNLGSDCVRERAITIDKASQYAETIILNALSKLKGE